jgi:tripartite-type tricarboxylate transporter receptor subunit TctC
MGRPFLGPPNIPPDRVAALRDAFMATMKDKDFLADTDKAQMEVNPVPGDRVQALVKEIYSTPPEIAQKAASFLR